MDRLQALRSIGNEWSKGAYHRIYFNDLDVRLGIDTARYNTGNISSATQDGEKISNSQARRILGRVGVSKFWYDCTNDKFYTRGELEKPEIARIKQSILDDIDRLIAEETPEVEDQADGPTFYVDRYRDLMVSMGTQTDTVIAPTFIQNENRDKAAEYLRGIARDLTAAFSEGDQARADTVLETAERKIRDAQTAEKFLEEVTF